MPEAASDEHELVVLVTRAVLHGRARSTGEVLAVLERAGQRLDLATVEAALVSAPAVEQVAPGVWRRR